MVSRFDLSITAGALALALAGALAPAAALGATACYTDACGTCSPPGGAGFAQSTLVADTLFPTGAEVPVEFIDPGDERGRRLIATQEGAILVYDAPGNTMLATPFLDLRSDGGGAGLDKVLYDFNERGLLALAVAPDYPASGQFYVYYTRNGSAAEDGDIVIERYTRSAGNPDVADPASGQVLLVIDHSQGNHNGGDLVFGQDGFLYISTGDGGGSCDSSGPNAQRDDRLLGKILRIDVAGVDPSPGAADNCGLLQQNYGIPTGNPYRGVVRDPDPCDEVWALGLRNPFRMTMDRLTGDFFIGDVGQDTWEEFDFLPELAAQSEPARNFGWKCREGCENTTCSTTNCPTLPDGETACAYPNEVATGVFYYDPITCHRNPAPGNWSSAMGGYLYRGDRVPSIAGRYVYSDTGCGQLWVTGVFNPASPAATTSACWEDTGFGIYGFAEDRLGEVYLVRGGNGRIDCLHAGAGCYWARWRGLFEDDFESNGFTHWTSTGGGF